jgi:hypothetical protein
LLHFITINTILPIRKEGLLYILFKLMKKFIAVVTLVVLVKMLQAQVSYSIFAGYNANTTAYKTNVYGSRVNTSITSGFHAGVFRKFEIENPIVFATGLTFINKGYIVNTKTTDSAKLQSSYYSIEIPALLQWNIGKSERIKPYVTFGPSLGYSFGGKNKITNAAGNTATSNKAYGNQLYSHYEASLNLFVGVQTAKGLFVETRFLNSLANIWNQDNSAVIKPKSLLLTVGYTFGKRKKLAFE